MDHQSGSVIGCETLGNPGAFAISMTQEGLAGEPGFEPGLTESESVGLPLTYSPAGASPEKSGQRGGL